MCLIIASPTGKPVSKEILEQAEQRNGHGAGVAWFEEASKRIEFRKDLDAAGVFEILQTDAKDKPWVAHFRIATHGGVCAELTHPFTIDEHASIKDSGHAKSVLFHNGTFPSWKEWLLQAASSSGTKIPEAPWSDSRGVAFLCHIYGKHVLSLLDNHSRWIVFDAEEKANDRMMLWGDWHDWGQFKFSHQGHPVFTSTTSSGRGGDRSTNFRQASEDAAENVAAKTDANKSSEATSKNSQESDPTSQTNTTSITTSASGSGTKTKRRFAMSSKFTNPWKSFTSEGLAVHGLNEPKEVVTV